MFTIFSQIQHENNFLPTSKHQQAKICRFVGMCLYDCFICRSNVVFRKIVSKWDAILAQVTKQWIAKDIITSYGSQPESVKITIHWFGKYLWEIFLMESELAAPKKQSLIIML